MTKEDFLVRVRTALCIDPTQMEMTPEEYAEALDEIGEDVATLAEAHEAVVDEETSAVSPRCLENAIVSTKFVRRLTLVD